MVCWHSGSAHYMLFPLVRSNISTMQSFFRCIPTYLPIFSLKQLSIKKYNYLFMYLFIYLALPSFSSKQSIWEMEHLNRIYLATTFSMEKSSIIQQCTDKYKKKTSHSMFRYQSVDKETIQCNKNLPSSASSG